MIRNYLKVAVLGVLGHTLLIGQLVTNTTAIPRREGRPPVVFVNGYQGGCSGVTFAGTFGSADAILARDNRVSLFFDNCSVGGNNTPIEELGIGLRNFISALRYEGGSPVPQVDIVAHSMGGLIVRSYLAGKQTADGVFAPPEDPKVRKVVFLATPHFGTPIAGGEGNRQTQQMTPGSNFLFDLATWNQNSDDLRGADTIAVLGNAGILTIGADWPRNFHDTTVALMSGSLEFALPGRTRILPVCHTTGIAALGCEAGAPPIANWNNDSHPAARLLVSFLNGTNEWTSAGEAPGANAFLRTGAGLFFRMRDANDRALPVERAEIRPEDSQTFTAMEVRNGSAYRERQQAGPVFIRLTSGQTQQTVAFSATPGAFRTQSLKTGPYLAAVTPAFQPLTPRTVAPGMFVTLWGTLANATEAAPAQPYPTTLGNTQVLLGDRALPLHYVSPGQINALLPDDISGLIKLTVRTPAGQHTTNVLVEAAAPSPFATAVNAVTGALITREAPARVGDFITIYVTGLGLAERRSDNLEWARVQPTVQIGNGECAVSFAGRHTVYAGLEQINCRVPPEAGTGDLRVTVRSGSRISSAITVPVQ